MAFATISWLIQLGVSLMAGMAFGLAVEKSRVFEPAVIRDQFLYSRFIMLKTFLSALTTSIIIFCLLSVISKTRKYFLQIRQSYMACLTRKGAVLSVAGGLMLGAGMAMAASCPGIVLAQIGTSVPNAKWTLLGCFAGVLLYSATESTLTNMLASKSHRPQTVDRYLGIPYSLLAIATAILTSSVVVIFELLFPWKTNYEMWDAGSGKSLFAQRAWPPYVSGIIIGLLQVPVTLTVGDTVGGSQSFCTLLSQCLVTEDLEKKLPYLAQFKHGIQNWWQVMFVIGAVAGAYTSAISSNSLGVADGVTPSAAFIGGTLMLYGARMAGGCTSGHGLSGFGLMMALSVMTVPAMFAGGTATAFILHLAHVL